MKKQRILWAALLITALIVAACAAAPADAPAGDADAPADAPASSSEASGSDEVFTYWGGLIFSDAANQMLVDRVTQWGEENGIETEVVMINQNETVQRVSAAIEAGTMPDALDVGRNFMLLLSESGQLEPLDDLYAEIGDSVGGWLPLADEATNPDLYGGNRYGIPFSLGGNVLFRRADVLEPAGFTDAPATWTELGEMATAQNPPETYGMGFALSNVGDANLTTTMLQSWGGRIADDAGENCTHGQPGNARVSGVDHGRVRGRASFPPAQQPGTARAITPPTSPATPLFIANPGSVYLYMRDERPRAGRRNPAIRRCLRVRLCRFRPWMPTCA